MEETKWKYMIPSLSSSTRPRGEASSVPIFAEKRLTLPATFHPWCLSCGNSLQAAWDQVKQDYADSGCQSLSPPKQEIYTRVFGRFRLTSECCRAAIMGTLPSKTVAVERNWRQPI